MMGNWVVSSLCLMSQSYLCNRVEVTRGIMFTYHVGFIPSIIMTGSGLILPKIGKNREGVCIMKCCTEKLHKLIEQMGLVMT